MIKTNEPTNTYPYEMDLIRAQQQLEQIDLRLDLGIFRRADRIERMILNDRLNNKS